MQILNRFRLKALPIQPENFPENLVWTYIIWNYPIYFVGAQFVLAPILGWLLLGYLTIKWWSQNEDTPEKDKIQISITSWIWVVATFVIALTHFIGCIDFNVDTYVMFRDFINGWIKMWALFAIFPLVGHLNIRPQLIYRAVCVFCAQSLVLVLLFWMIAFATDGHSFTYISPFLKIGGQLNYYSIIIGNALDIEEKRIYLNAPWAPALGMMAGIYLFLTLQERHQTWRLLGIIGSIAMILSTFSRTAIVGVPLIFLFVQSAIFIFRPFVLFAWGGVSLFVTLSIDPILKALQDAISGVKQYRSGSTRAREELNQLAFNAWKEESILWGHGSYFERSSLLSGGRTFVSDSTLNGVLYTNGLMGAIALTILFVWTFFNLLSKFNRHPYAKVGFEILCVLLLFLGTENIQATAYIYWPGLIVLGSAFKSFKPVGVVHDLTGDNASSFRTFSTSGSHSLSISRRF